MADNCFVCQTRLADTTFEVGMRRRLDQTNVQYINVPVPICANCKAQELRNMSAKARWALGVWAVLVIGGAVLGGWAGAGAGFGIGFFVSIAVNALPKPSRLTEHPSVKAREPEGYRVSYP